MVLSEAEAEARLAALRREREALDRAIADLTLYLELGRRLTGGAPPAPDAIGRGPAGASTGLAPGRDSAPAGSPIPDGAAQDAPFSAHRRVAVAGEGDAAGPAPAPPPAEAGPAGAPGLDDEGAALSETVLARRYGRAVIAAALMVLEEAGRPLHAGEIQAALAARGFALPGHDPVAALNTRLWKRSGPGGPLRRLGEAVYALAEDGDAE